MGEDPKWHQCSGNGSTIHYTLVKGVVNGLWRYSIRMEEEGHGCQSLSWWKQYEELATPDEARQHLVREVQQIALGCPHKYSEGDQNHREARRQQRELVKWRALLRKKMGSLGTEAQIDEIT
eukprot:2214776-Pyramimonas_sp.AAC.1